MQIPHWPAALAVSRPTTTKQWMLVFCQHYCLLTSARVCELFELVVVVVVCTGTPAWWLRAHQSGVPIQSKRSSATSACQRLLWLVGRSQLLPLRSRRRWQPLPAELLWGHCLSFPAAPAIARRMQWARDQQILLQDIPSVHFNNNNYYNQDDIYSAVIMTTMSLREFTQFIWWMYNSAKWPPTLGPSHLTWAVSPPVGCCCPQPQSPFIIITQSESWYSFSIPQRVEGWADMYTSICVICFVYFLWQSKSYYTENLPFCTIFQLIFLLFFFQVLFLCSFKTFHPDIRRPCLSDWCAL